MTKHQELAQEQQAAAPAAPASVPAEESGSASGTPRRAGSGARHRQHVFPGRGLVIKARYTEDEQAAVAQAAELTGLRPAGFVAAAALLLARSLTGAEPGELEAPVAEDAGEVDRAPVLGGRPVLVAWSAGQDRELLEELVQTRLALRRYGVNVNQAVAALNSGGQAPVWLEQAVAGSDRAVARVDEAAAALTRRLI